MNKIKIIIIDDHTLLRTMLIQRFEKEPLFDVVANDETAERAVDLVISTHPDVILMDIDMPGPICFDVAQRISTIQPDVKFIFLSAFTYDRYIEKALDVGALGYLTKQESPEIIISAIKNAYEGRSSFSPEVYERMLVNDKGVTLTIKNFTRSSTLTAREIEVVCYLARGLTKKEIAKMMHISINTVDKHATNLMNKLNIHNRVELTRYAYQEDLIKL